MARIRYEDFVPKTASTAKRGATASSVARATAPPTRAEVDGAIRRLPALPALLQELLRELRDTNADIGRLEERIASDASLTTRVLKMANSPFYQRSAEVVDVRRAVMTLGFRTVANLVLAAGLRNTMSKAQKVPGYVGNGVFLFSLASGLACARLARGSAALGPVADGLFVAGLLHDVGRIAMAEFYERLAPLVEAGKPFTLDPPFEREHLGIDHQEVGALVMEQWGLPEELHGAITRHHEPVDAIRDEPLILGVAIVDATLELHGYARTQPNGALAPRVEELAEALGIEASLVDGVFDAIQDEVKSLAESFA